MRQETALVEAIRSGDDIAATEFCDKFSPRLIAVIRAKRVPTQDTEPVLQDILAAALQQLQHGRFRGESRLGTWLYSLANARIADYWRSAVPARRFIQFDNLPGGVPNSMVEYRAEDIIAVKEALVCLTREDRFVLWLHDVEGFTLEEIGQLVARKKSAVAERLARARKRFRTALTERTGRIPEEMRLKE